MLQWLCCVTEDKLCYSGYAVLQRISYVTEVMLCYSGYAVLQRLCYVTVVMLSTNQVQRAHVYPLLTKLQ